MDQMGRRGCGPILNNRWNESALHRSRPAVLSRLVCLDHDFKNVERMFGRDQRRRLAVNALYQMSKPLSPRPIRMGLLEALPATGAVLPDLVAVGVPIITQHVDGAVCSVKFQPRKLASP